MRSNRARFALLASLFAAACTFDEITIPKTTPTVVVHSVLNPASFTQLVLLERSLSGAVTVQDTSFDPNNPIATAGGHGDELVKLKVMTPSEPDPALEEFLSSWTPSSNYDPRRDMQS